MEVRSSRAEGRPSVSVFAEDRGPVPHVVEDDSEETWREYDACMAELDAELEKLRHTLSRLSTGSHTRLRDIEARFSEELSREVDVEDVMALVRTNGRVCPNPGIWRAMYMLLPLGNLRGRIERAPYPVDLREWNQTTDLQKQLRLREQLEWAQAQGALQRVRDYLAGLRESDWQHSVPMDWPRI